MPFSDNPFCFLNIMESRLRFFVSAPDSHANPLYLNEIEIETFCRYTLTTFCFYYIMESHGDRATGHSGHRTV